MSQAHWHVLGAGAMGCLFASALQRSGTRTTLLLREQAAGAPEPVVVQGEDAIHRYQIPLESTADTGTISHLLVATKAYDIRGAVAAVRSRLLDNSQILLLSNGMGFIAELRADQLEQRIYCGTTTEGAYRLGTRHIHHAGRGETRIGIPREPGELDSAEAPGSAVPPPWFEQWTRALAPCHWDPRIDRALWLKLAINCVINPLTALHRCPNGALAERQELAREVTHLCREISHISHAAGFVDIGPILLQSVTSVIKGTAKNRSSMLQDVEAGRRTEIDYITGHLLAVASRYGLAAPHNENIMERMQNIA